MGSLYKPASSRNLNCSVVCFLLLHCSRQTAVSQPPMPSAEETEQRNLWVQNAQKICKYFRASEFSKPVSFALKLQRARMNTKLVAGGLGENDSD